MDLDEISDEHPGDVRTAAEDLGSFNIFWIAALFAYYWYCCEGEVGVRCKRELVDQMESRRP